MILIPKRNDFMSSESAVISPLQQFQVATTPTSRDIDPRIDPRARLALTLSRANE